MMARRYVLVSATMFSMLFASVCMSSSSDSSLLAQNSIDPQSGQSALPTAAGANADSSGNRSQQMAYAYGYDSGVNIRARQDYLFSRTSQKLIRIENVQQAIRDAWSDQPLQYNDKQRDDAKKEVDQLLVKSWVPALGSGDSAIANLSASYSYALGVELAFSIRLMRDQMDLQQLLIGLGQGFNQVSARLDPTTRGALLSVIHDELESRRIRMNAGNWQKSIDFMISNGKRPGVKTLPSGLQYEVIKTGHGSSPGKTDRVTVAYTGTLIDGQVFDDSRSRGRPVTFPLNNVILGFTEGLGLMSVGGRFKLFIPPELAYGDRGAGTKIEPNQAVIFDIELLDFQHVEGAINLTPYREASARFSEIISAAEQHNAPSELQSKEAMRLVAVLSDDGRFLNAKTYGATDLGDLTDLCGMSNKAVVKLSLFNVKAQVDASTPKTEAVGKVSALMNANIRTFGGQLKYLHPFLMRCLAAEVSPLTEFTQSLSSTQFNDERRKGLKQMSTGIEELFTGVLQGVVDKSYDQEYRWALVSTLADIAPRFVSVSQLPVRKKLRELAISAQLTSPSTFTPFLQRIGESLDDSTCMGLCAIQKQTETIAAASTGTNRSGSISWITQIAAKIRSNWTMPVGRPKTFDCRVKVNVMPNGSINSAKIIKSCGQEAWDASLLRAVFKSDPLPTPDDPNDFDQNLNLTFSS